MSSARAVSVSWNDGCARGLGCIVSSTSRIFSAVSQRRRRWTDVITSTRGDRLRTYCCEH